MTTTAGRVVIHSALKFTDGVSENEDADSGDSVDAAKGRREEAEGAKNCCGCISNHVVD